MSDNRTKVLATAKAGDCNGMKALLIGDLSLIHAQEEKTLRTCVHKAAEGGCAEMLEVLLAFGADLNAADAALQTPLHIASEAGHLEVVEFLVSRGADCSTDARGWTALNYSMDLEHAAITTALLDSVFADIDAAEAAAAEAAGGEEEEDDEEDDVGDEEVVEVTIEDAEKEKRKRDSSVANRKITARGNTAVSSQVSLRTKPKKADRKAKNAEWRGTLAGDLATKIATERQIRGTIAGLDQLLEETPAELTIRTKKQDKKVIDAFNKDPKTGVQQLLGVPIFDDTAEPSDPALRERQIARVTEFLHRFLDQAYQPCLDRKQVGMFLGGSKPFVNAVRDAFIASMDFSILEFVTAMRHFLHWFQLPCEAQQIDRIMESFAKTFYKQYQPVCPSWSFADFDAVYLLAFATIMLNTDLHNPNIKKKKTMAQFIDSLQGCNKGGDFEKEFLEDLYGSIAYDEVRAESRFNLSFKRGWLQVGSGRSKKARWVVLDPSGFYIFKSEPSAEHKPLYHCPLRSISAIYRSATDEKKRIFQVHTAEKRFRFQPRSNIQYRVWIHFLALASRKSRE